jgi:prolyl-tRNA synthetase
MRIEIGPRDVAAGTLMSVMRTDWSGGERKQAQAEAEAIRTAPARLEAYQRFLLERSVERREAASRRGISDYGKLREIIEDAGGFVYGGWCGSGDCEARVKEETKATIRLLPDPEFRSPEAPRVCAVCGAAAQGEAIWARAY